jgi:hypothetical protein
MMINRQGNDLRGERSYDRLLEDGATGRNGNSSIINANLQRSAPTDESTPLSSSPAATHTSSDGNEREERIVLVVLDMKQHRFRVKASPDWTVGEVSLNKYSRSLPQGGRILLVVALEEW